MNKEFYDKVCLRCSRITARNYSTSFSLGIRCLEKEFRDPIYSIYGFVRFADEIVDSFYEYDKATLLERFKQDTYLAIDEKISLNPILNSFQKTVSLALFNNPNDLTACSRLCSSNARSTNA